ncbi:MAG TPA: hypothetical protein PKB09_02185 [Candidatus Saccharibacteria bacterium]|nr:hypothetical protein [Candidatus Saccharibacteria bacterium]
MGEIDRGYTPQDEEGPRTVEELLALEGFIKQVQEGAGSLEYDEQGLPIIPDANTGDEFEIGPNIIRGEE